MSFEFVPDFFGNFPPFFLYPIPSVIATQAKTGHKKHQGPGILTKMLGIYPDAKEGGCHGRYCNGPAHHAEHAETKPDLFVLFLGIELTFFPVQNFVREAIFTILYHVLASVTEVEDPFQETDF